MQSMLGYVLHGPKDIRRETRTAPAVSPGMVVAKISRAGICGSDIHYYTEGYIGDFVPRAPFVLGHEFSGTVVETGEGVSDFAAGDRIAVEPSIACGECHYCRIGRYNLCTNMKFFGSASSYPHLDGGFAQYVAVPARNCFHLPDSIDDEVGALVEPLAVAAHALQRAGTVAGKTVLITGGGTIGQAVLTIARALGAGKIAVSDIDAFCRAFAVEHGAEAALDPRSQDFAEEAKRLAPNGFDLVFEASGVPQALIQGIQLAARGGTLVQIGTQPKEAAMPVNLTMSKELQIVGSFRYAHVFPLVLQLLTTGRISAGHLITQRFDFDHLKEALDTAVKGDSVIKVQVQIA